MNTLLNIENFGVVILAAGQGTRLGCEDKPKVMMEIGGKPIISYIIETLFKVGFRGRQICLVVGFKREKVIDYFGGRLIYAYQDEQLGTAHAAYMGMKVLPENISNVLVLNGDDSAFYKPATLENLIQRHIDNGSMATLLSTTIDSSSFGYGRVVRKSDGMIEIIEKEYLNAENKNTNETSTGTFCFNRNWYVSMFPNMPMIEKLGEYGLPTAFTTAQREGLPAQVVELENPEEWFGINTPDELVEAEKRKKLFL